jgi:cytochrome c-type biogenesis protein
MLETSTVTPLASFFAGVLSVLSPCVLPLLPIVLAYSTGQSKLRPLAIITGLTISFTTMGIVASAFGAVFLPYIDKLRIIAEITIILIGLGMLMEKDMFGFLSQYTGKIRTSGMLPDGEKGLFGGLAVGMALGIVWIPCVGPILASILTIVALKSDIYYGSGLLFIYSIGFAIPMLIIAYSAKISGDRLSRLSGFDVKLKKVAGAILVIAGLWMIYSSHLVA